MQEIDGFGGRSLQALEPGLGKTLISLWWIAEKPEQRLPTVVVCPLSVKWHWEREAKEKCGMEDVGVLEGRKPTGEKLSSLTILNFDILAGRLDELRKLKPKTIILDEVQAIANQTKRTTAVRNLCKGVPNVLALSGTPLVNRPIELLNTLRILRPDVPEFRSKIIFGDRFCGRFLSHWGWDYKGATNTDKLNKLLAATCMSRRRKVDVLPDLPPKIRDVVALPLSDPREYQRASDDFLGWLTKEKPNVVNRAAKAKALTRVSYLLQLAAKLKLKSAIEWINDLLAGGEKVVVFATHRKMISALSRRLNCESVIIDGTVTGADRQRAVDRFQTDPKVRVAICNIVAGGTGITLTAASTVVFVELDWRPGVHLQAEDRPHRIGTTKPVWIHYLVAHGTVEEKLCSVLQAKQKVLNAVLDGGKVENDLTVFDLLMKEMKLEKEN